MNDQTPLLRPVEERLRRRKRKEGIGGDEVDHLDKGNDDGKAYEDALHPASAGSTQGRSILR